MSTLKKFVACVLGPRLFQFYKLQGNTLATKTPDVLSTTHKYVPNQFESIPDALIKVSKLLSNFGPYVSMVLFCYVFYKRQIESPIEMQSFLKLLATLLTIYASSFLIRGYGRFTNPEYVTFLRVLEASKKNLSISNKRILAHFDFDFDSHPVDFSWNEAPDKSPPSPYQKSFPSDESKYQVQPEITNSSLEKLFGFIGGIVMNVAGKRIIYPGTLGFLQTLMSPAIEAGRKKLIEEHDGVRYKLLSYTGDYIESFFIDKRSSAPNANGNFLVVGCEGNGGFYEVGTILTPLEAGYSVLGWNHPGFGGSTGFPYPDNEVAAVDTVMRFAIERLKFPEEKIIVYGWSIGGFTATWAGMRFPKVYGLVIDASFDHIIPLAKKVVPGPVGTIAEIAIKTTFDLNNSRHLENFKGPVLIIRRSQDEVISLDPYNSPSTNRANDLLIHLLEQRFPLLMDDRGRRVVKEYCAGNARYQNAVLTKYGVNSRACVELLASYFHTNPTRYEVNIGPDIDNSTRDRLVLYLVSKHLLDYDSVHCAPLPPRYFQRPFDLIEFVMGYK